MFSGGQTLIFSPNMVGCDPSHTSIYDTSVRRIAVTWRTNRSFIKRSLAKYTDNVVINILMYN